MNYKNYKRWLFSAAATKPLSVTSGRVTAVADNMVAPKKFASANLGSSRTQALVQVAHSRIELLFQE